MARSTFYYHLKQLKFPDKYKQEKNEIVSIYHDHKGRYGYRRITVEMHNRGYSINHKTALRLMNECGVKCQVRLKKYRSYKGEVGAVVPDLLKRNFMAERPNQKWVTDLTEFSLFGKKLYLSPIMDLYNREIISYNIAEHPTVPGGIKCGRLPEATIREDLPTILEKFNLLHEGKLNNASAVLFGRDFYYYPQCLLRLACFKGTTILV